MCVCACAGVCVCVCVESACAQVCLRVRARVPWCVCVCVLEDHGVPLGRVQVSKCFARARRHNHRANAKQPMFTPARHQARRPFCQSLNGVLGYAFRVAQRRWQERCWGIVLGTTSTGLLCMVRFAHDVKLAAIPKKQLSLRLRASSKQRGVDQEIHVGKMKVQTNRARDNRQLQKCTVAQKKSLKCPGLWKQHWRRMNVGSQMKSQSHLSQSEMTTKHGSLNMDTALVCPVRRDGQP